MGLVRCCEKRDPVHFNFGKKGAAWICVQCKKQLSGKPVAEEAIDLCANIILEHRFFDEEKRKEL